MSDLTQSLKTDTIQTIKFSTPPTVHRTTSLKETMAQMKDAKTSCAIVLENGDSAKILGIFTERDVLTRVIEQNVDQATAIEKVMTTNPKVLKATDSVADAIRLMNQGRYRHIPIVNDSQQLVGVLSVRDLLTYLSEHYPYEVYNLPPDPQQVMQTPEGA